MLIGIKIKNFLSFKDEVFFSMHAATPVKELPENTFTYHTDKILRSAVVYGANASGKSNLLKAFSFIRRFVLNSSKESLATKKIRVDNFKFSTTTESEPSMFEISFIHEQNKYRYGFTVDTVKVHSEWLFTTPMLPKKRESNLFSRNGQTIVSNFKEGKGLEERTRENALFLSVVAQFNGELSIKIADWFQQYLSISFHENIGLGPFNTDKILGYKDETTKFLKIADLAIEGFTIDKEKQSFEDLDIPDEVKKFFSETESIKIQTIHNKYDNENRLKDTINFPFDHESHGTQKLFFLSSLIIDSLKKGSTLVIDELDSRLHPLITLHIIKLFNSNTLNINNAQLIFATHDTNLLNTKNFRRDQIWFTEKNQFGSTSLYSLIEYKVRNDASLEKNYILGKYGAIPFIGNPEVIFKRNSNE